MNFRLVMAAGMIFGLLAAPAAAQIRPHAFYLSPQVGGYFFHGDQELKDAPMFSLGIGYHFSKNWSGEFTGAYVDTESKIGSQQSVDLYLARFALLYHFRPEGRLVPHLTLGAGGLLFDGADGGSDLDAFIDYGVGLEYFINKSVSVMLQGRHMFTGENRHFEGKEFQNFVATAGINFQIGGETERPEVIDTDGDGVIDAFDRCPGTPLGVPVDGYGCPADADRDGVPDYLDQCPNTPAGAAVDRQGCPADADRDGVPDYLDQCAGTPAGQKVDQHGCPVRATDTDGDGVADDQDACPNTPAGVAVNQYGCPAEARVKPPVAEAVAPPSLALQLEFRSNQSDLRPEFEDKLRLAVDFLRANPGKKILVEGHTDAVGPAEANQALSQARANTIRRYLIETTGVDPQRIEARGYGESRPIADNATQAGRAQNRRVVVRVAE
ncbi:MAG: OmpA family protein [Desulfuromonadales bacterium]|nr:OmpA family protein [Desulfuromonadales bacterium]